MKKVIFLPVFLILVLSSCKKLGCTDPNANNYNSSANEDNGNCTYSLMDIEGNSYGAKKIGNQIWMTENLKVKKYRNGDIIPQVQDSLQWRQLTTGAWCYYENDPSKGILYNWFAVNDPRGLAPNGYHVPTFAEWTNLEIFLGNDAGTKMKSTSGWTGNGNGSNSSGFSGLPCGFRLSGSFSGIGDVGHWWSSSESGNNFAWSLFLEFYGGYVHKYEYYMEEGFSVRCLKD